MKIIILIFGFSLTFLTVITVLIMCSNVTDASPNPNLYRTTTFTFTPPPPIEYDPPVLENPPAEAVFCDARPTFHWQENSKFDYVYIIIGYDAVLRESIIAAQWQTPPYRTSFELPDGTYYWAVRGYYVDGGSAISEIRKLTLAEVNEPTSLGIKEGNYICTTEPTFTWIKGSNPYIGEYELELARNQEFTIEPQTVSVNRNQTQFQFEHPLELGSYFWRMRGISETSCEGVWIPGPNFQIRAENLCN